MRKRFRGNQPVALSVEKEGGTRGHQLYAGKPMYREPTATEEAEEKS
jgi:cytochrome c oxidase assembly factor 5